MSGKALERNRLYRGIEQWLVHLTLTQGMEVRTFLPLPYMPGGLFSVSRGRNTEPYL